MCEGRGNIYIFYIYFIYIIYMMQIHRWCQHYPPPVTRVTRDVGKNFWEKFSKQNIFLFCWATFWQHFFVATTNSNKKTTNVKKWGLLLLVVATNFFYRFFLYHHVGAHLKIFWRARAATHRKNCLNIKENACFY